MFTTVKPLKYQIMTSQTSEVFSYLKETKDSIETHLHHFYHWEKAKAQDIYLKQPVGNNWINYTWEETGNQSRRIAQALLSMDLGPNSNIGIIAKNCPHWIMADLAIGMSAHVSVPFYPNLPSQQLRQVLEHSECKVLFVGKTEMWSEQLQGVPEGLTVIALPEYGSPAIPMERVNFYWDDLLQKHEPLQENPSPQKEDLSTIIYTSGTTGTPKGVMFDYESSSSLISETAPTLELYPEKPNRFFSYLPLCHIAERAFVERGSLYTGGTIYFSESLETFAQNLQEARPTHFFGVPRIWTKFQLGVLEKMPQKKLDFYFKLPILGKMVKNKIKKKLGLDQTRIMLTGAAPSTQSMLNWYQDLGLIIREVYGMTENGGGCTLMPKEYIKSGTVGKPHTNVEIAIAPETNEVLMRSKGVMKGYYKDPERTQQTLQDGWLHTGDMGELDEEGFLKITGRVKDMFKTSKGEYVVPAPIEWKFSSNTDIEQICILGSKLPQPMALVVLSEIGKQRPITEVSKGLKDDLARVNGELINYEQLRKIIIVKDAWNQENGMLTPTLKIKRNVLEAFYKERLEKWYNSNVDIILEDPS